MVRLLRALSLALALLGGAPLLTGCAPIQPEESASAEADGAASAVGPSIADLIFAPESGDEALAASPGSPSDSPPAETRSATPDALPPVPHIYLALQPGGSGFPTSVVFAIDAARDGTPSDDPAIRLTPEAGRCNPQEMRRYDFPEDAAPVVSEPEQAKGLTADDLPDFLAAAVTGRLIEAGLATEPEDTRPLNVCTRKLWQRLVVAGNRDRLAQAQ